MSPVGGENSRVLIATNDAGDVIGECSRGLVRFSRICSFPRL